MNCSELERLLPDLVDGKLAEAIRLEATMALQNCPECQRQLELAQQVHAFLLQLQTENERFRVPAGFEVRLLARVRQQSGGLDLFNLSSQAFAVWLVELINLIGGLLDPHFVTVNHPQTA